MSRPLVLFGAFDRHNLGDLLLAHVAARMVPRYGIVAAGLVERDLRAEGGHRVVALSALEMPVDVLHVGGEVLTCRCFEAAVMLQAPESAAVAIARYAREPDAGEAWSRRRLHTARRLPYLLAPEEGGRRLFAGVGGVMFDRLPVLARQEALAALGGADASWVRDRRTQLQLEAAGLQTALAPDPAELVAALFGRRIERHATAGPVAALRRRYPQGYLAIQFGAEHGDDATLAAVAEQLGRIRAGTGLGIAFFCAGRAPWHDDRAVYRRLIRRAALEAEVCEATNVWDICALLAHASAVVGTSLHARIVADALLRPAVSLLAGGDAATKLGAYLETWRAPHHRSVATAATLTEQVAEARSATAAERINATTERAAAVRGAYRRLIASLSN